MYVEFRVWNLLELLSRKNCYRHIIFIVGLSKNPSRDFFISFIALVNLHTDGISSHQTVEWVYRIHSIEKSCFIKLYKGRYCSEPAVNNMRRFTFHGALSSFDRENKLVTSDIKATIHIFALVWLEWKSLFTCMAHNCSIYYRRRGWNYRYSIIETSFCSWWKSF